MRRHPTGKDPRAAATARGSEIVALRKPTLAHYANRQLVKSENDYRSETGEAVIFEHAKSGNKLLVVKYAEFKGHPYLDVREWVDEPDGRKATRKGVTVPLGVVRRLGEALLASSWPDDEAASGAA